MTTKNPFDFLNAINTSKIDLIKESDSPVEQERAYAPFMVNRGLSYFPETILYAQDMNLYHGLDKYLQFSYLLNSCRKAKRFSKWSKAKKDEDVVMLTEYYNCSAKKAQEIIRILTPEQLEQIRKTYNNKGGTAK